MINTSTYAYLIECITNLHAGSGDNNYAVIDKQVQRDTVSSLPVIHSSGLKGALREYFENAVKPKKPELIIKYFGSGKDEKTNLSQGLLRVFEARLLSIPVRSRDENEVFYRATTKHIVEELNVFSSSLGEPIDINFPEDSVANADTEFGIAPCYGTIAAAGPNVVAFSNDQMIAYSTHLPLIARNCLDNGLSKNLWYEEVVPRETRFYFFITVPEEMKSDYETEFEVHLHNKTIQIGANATVGYGLCKISKIK